MTPPTRQWGPPRTPPKQQAKRSLAVKGSPTGPREARRQAVPLDGRAQRSYPHNRARRTATDWFENCGRPIKGSDTPHLLGGDLPQAQRVRRTPTLRTNPPGPQVADRGADRVSQVRRPHQGPTYPAAHFAQLRGRRGEPTAIGATRYDILIAYYIVRDQVPCRELGPDWLRRRYSREHRARRLLQQLEGLGYKVKLEQASPAEQEASAAARPATTAARLPTSPRRCQRALPERLSRPGGIHTPAALVPVH
jgi:hypothetical protein